jgi:lipopolysaccharide/colanic/teichoic acid biosynthesis glycosyltransferase
MQRLFDLILACIAIILASPLLLIVAFALVLTGEHEVLFFQNRIGRRGQVFKLCKFATMLKNSPSIGTGTVTIEGDPRVLPLGRLLRSTKINELPQLFNILKGDMGFVGPRPQTEQCFNAYPAEMREIILQMKPGLSGIGSIVFRNEAALLKNSKDAISGYNNLIAPYKAQLEVWYYQNQNLTTYWTVIMITILVVLFPKSQLVWRAFDGLPEPPDKIKSMLGYNRVSKGFKY